MYKKKTSKYKNVKTIVDGINFDSKGEAERFRYLKLMQLDGVISGLECQKRFELLPKQEGERPVHYIADFVYNRNGEQIVEDFKSRATRTRDYILKRKMMKYFHGITILETGK